MPLNASNGVFQLEYTLLPARFRAAENALRIPKVLRESCRKPCFTHCFIDCFPLFIDGFPCYPGWAPRSWSCLLFYWNPGKHCFTVFSAAVCTVIRIKAARADGSKPQRETVNNTLFYTVINSFLTTIERNQGSQRHTRGNPGNKENSVILRYPQDGSSHPVVLFYLAGK